MASISKISWCTPMSDSLFAHSETFSETCWSILMEATRCECHRSPEAPLQHALRSFLCQSYATFWYDVRPTRAELHVETPANERSQICAAFTSVLLCVANPARPARRAASLGSRRPDSRTLRSVSCRASHRAFKIRSNAGFAAAARASNIWLGTMAAVWDVPSAVSCKLPPCTTRRLPCCHPRNGHSSNRVKMPWPNNAKLGYRRN